MFSGRRDRVWSDNSIHLFYCPKTGGIPHVVLCSSHHKGRHPVHYGNCEETNRRVLTNAGLTPSLSEVKESTLRPYGAFFISHSGLRFAAFSRCAHGLCR